MVALSVGGVTKDGETLHYATLDQISTLLHYKTENYYIALTQYITTLHCYAFLLFFSPTFHRKAPSPVCAGMVVIEFHTGIIRYRAIYGRACEPYIMALWSFTEIQ